MKTSNIRTMSYDALGITIHYVRPVNGTYKTFVPFLCPIGNKMENASRVFWTIVHQHPELQDKIGAPRS